jgi:hypothetical protein
LNVTPMVLKSLRSLPPHTSHVVSASSVNAWWMSKALSHSVQRYE